VRGWGFKATPVGLLHPERLSKKITPAAAKIKEKIVQPAFAHYGCSENAASPRGWTLPPQQSMVQSVSCSLNWCDREWM